MFTISDVYLSNMLWNVSARLAILFVLILVTYHISHLSWSLMTTSTFNCQHYSHSPHTSTASRIARSSPSLMSSRRSRCNEWRRRIISWCIWFCWLKTYHILISIYTGAAAGPRKNANQTKSPIRQKSLMILIRRFDFLFLMSFVYPTPSIDISVIHIYNYLINEIFLFW